MQARYKALAIAKKELGVHEVPPNSNWGPRVKVYLKSAGWTTPAPWCMAFMHWCFEQAGMKIGGGASVGFFEDWARKHKNGEIVKRPFKGDLVCYRFDSDNWPDHVGIVERVLALRWRHKVFVGWVQIIEGNTGVGNDANGGKVMRRRRWVKRCKFVRLYG